MIFPVLTITFFSPRLSYYSNSITERKKNKEGRKNISEKNNYMIQPRILKANKTPEISNNLQLSIYVAYPLIKDGKERNCSYAMFYHHLNPN